MASRTIKWLFLVATAGLIVPSGLAMAQFPQVAFWATTTPVAFSFMNMFQCSGVTAVSNSVTLSWSSGVTLYATCTAPCTNIIQNNVSLFCTSGCGPFKSGDTIAISTVGTCTKTGKSSYNCPSVNTNVTVGGTTSATWTVGVDAPGSPGC